MEEETPKQEEKKELSIIEQAKAEREALEKVRDEARAEVLKLQNLKAESMLSGTAGAAKQKQEAPKEETPQEYKDRIMRGEGGPRRKEA